MRKNGFRKLLAVCAVMMAAGLLGGCSSDSSSGPASSPGSASGEAKSEYGVSYQLDSSMEKEEIANDAQGSAAESTQVQQSGKKLIKTVDMTVETKEFDKLMKELTAKAEQLGGYVENLNTYNGSAYSDYRSSKSASLTIRIPREGLDDFLNTLSETGNVVSRSEREEDITLTYVDLESRRDSLQTEYTRLMELLEKAESIEDIIVLEERLSNVRYQLESMVSQLRTFDNKIDYSTVNLNIEEVQVLTPAGEEDTWGRITGGFTSSLKNIGNGIKESAIWFLAKSPYLIIWAVIIIAIIIIIRRIIKKSNAKGMRYTGNIPYNSPQPENQTEAGQAETK